VTSREIGWAFFTPAESFLADSRVLQAGELLAEYSEGIEISCHTNGDFNACITENVKRWSCHEACAEHENFPVKLSDRSRNAENWGCYFDPVMIALPWSRRGEGEEMLST
jgi:hypothetical protein